MTTASRWTRAQREAIEARDRPLLVSAGAGAGKTATLVERVARIVTDPRGGGSIESILMVTFTRAAAAEMRDRIASRLHEALDAARAAHEPPERLRALQSQLTLLPRAPISTLHSFCLSLLREESEAAGVPPDFELMSDDESRLLYAEAIEEAIEAALRDDATRAVVLDVLTQLPPATGVDQLAGIVRGVVDFLEAMSDPIGYVRSVLDGYAEAANPTIAFAATRVGPAFEALLRRPIQAALDAATAFLRRNSGHGLRPGKGPATYHEGVVAMHARLSEVAAGLQPETPLADFGELMRLPRRPASNLKTDIDEELALIEDAVDLTERIKALRGELAAWPAEATLTSLVREYGSTEPIVGLLLDRLGLQVSEAVLKRHLEQRRLSYAHLERLALRLLIPADGGESPASKRLRTEFDHVLVDEFQDVNELQATLLRAIARPPGDARRPGNLFAVGDVKQSIYGFRQADPSQFLGLLASYPAFDAAQSQPGGACITLAENFRSAPSLLRALNAFFEPLFTPRIGGVRFDAGHRFIAGRPEVDAPHPRFEVHLLPALRDAPPDEVETDEIEDSTGEEIEARHVARLVAGMVERGEAKPRDIAILLRSASGTATTVIGALREVGVRYQTRESLGFLSQQEVRDALSLLRVIDNPYRDVALIGVLRGPAADWSEDDLAHLRLLDRGARLFDNLRRAARETDTPIHAAARRFTERLDAWRAAAHRLSMLDLFALLDDELHLGARLATLPNAAQRLLNLSYLRDRAAQFDAFRRKGLGRFLRFLDDLLARDESLGQPPALASEEDAVQVMTIHKSKGLQFPVVVVPFLGKRFNVSDLNDAVLMDARAGCSTAFVPGRKYGEKRFVAARALMREGARDRLMSEELRLMYVALTRAEERLFLVGSRTKLRETVDDRAGCSRPVADDVVEAVAGAQTRLDWVLASLAGHPALDGKPTDDGVAVHVLDGAGEDSPAAATPDPPAEPSAPIWVPPPGMADAIARIAAREQRSVAVAARAKVSVTEAKRAFESLHGPDNPPAPRPRFRRRATAEQPLPPWFPAPLRDASRMGSAERGTLTHRLIALLDLFAVAEGVGASPQLGRLVESGFFTADEAASIDTGAIDTFFTDPLGEAVLANRARVRREVAFTIGVPVGDLAADLPPGETVLLQGMIDLMFEDARGNLAILDFKTDRWGGSTEEFDTLAAAYTPQLQLYRLGIERALGRIVPRASLYFLSANEEVQVARNDGFDWAAYVRAAVMGQPPAAT